MSGEVRTVLKRRLSAQGKKGASETPKRTKKNELDRWAPTAALNYRHIAKRKMPSNNAAAVTLARRTARIGPLFECGQESETTICPELTGTCLCVCVTR